MIAHSIPIPDRGYNIERPLSDDVHGLVPARIQVTVDYPGLSKTFLILITEDHIGVARAIHVAGLEVFRLHDLDRKNVIVGFLLPLRDWRRMTLDHSGTSVDIHFMLELVQLLSSEVDVVEFDERLEKVSASNVQSARRRS